MRHFTLSLAAPLAPLFALCLGLAGCDASEPEDTETFGQPAELVGAWAYVVREQATFASYSADQTLILLDGTPDAKPVLGDLPMPPALASATRLYEVPSRFTFEAATFAAGAPSTPGVPRWSLGLLANDRGVTVSVVYTDADGSTERYGSDEMPPTVFARFAEGFSVAPITLTSAVAPPLTFSLEARFPVLDIPANTPTEVGRRRQERRSATIGWRPDVWQFDADGGLSLSLWQSERYSSPIRSQWEASTDLFQRLDQKEIAIPKRANYAIRDDSLRFSVTDYACTSCQLSNVYEVNPDARLNGYAVIGTFVLAPTDSVRL